ncbi:MAG: gamma-glutamylcyclotransferase [Saprospiraceae bacterium]|nr:gamma-glutamylcyclotransferase [Saprospiraceae bacterium]
MSEIQRLFVYGTLAPGKPNEHILAGINGHWQPASVIGTLHEEGWGADMGYPGIKLSKQGTLVQGLIFSSYELEQHWSRLDVFEGDAYHRVLTTAKLSDQRQISTFIYVLA